MSAQTAATPDTHGIRVMVATKDRRGFPKTVSLNAFFTLFLVTLTLPRNASDNDIERKREAKHHNHFKLPAMAIMNSTTTIF